MVEKNIDDYWNVDGDRELTDAWTGFTIFAELKEKTPDGNTWSGRRLSRKPNDLQAGQIMARNVETHVRCIETQREAKVGNRETKARKCERFA